MLKLRSLSLLAIMAISGCLCAQIEPSSVKASFKVTETQTCDNANNCDGEGKASMSGAQTFDLPSSISDQFGPDTEIGISSIDTGMLTFKFSEDPKYQLGSTSINIKKTETGMDYTQDLSLKMSWKNGVCKVSFKGKAVFTGGIIALTKTKGLEPGNPYSTSQMAVVFDNGGSTIGTSVGYFAVQGSQKMSIKSLPNNAYSQKMQYSIKSKYQVGEPLGVPI